MSDTYKSRCFCVSSVACMSDKLESKQFIGSRVSSVSTVSTVSGVSHIYESSKSRVTRISGVSHTCESNRLRVTRVSDVVLLLLCGNKVLRVNDHAC